MNTIYADLEKSYTARCGNHNRALDAWRSFAEAYPPSITALSGPLPLPSRSLALEAGDLGLSILWIVQSTIVRAFANDIARDMEAPFPALDSLTATVIGSLAHSEDRAAPVIIRNSGGNLIMSGKKKYITGGLDSDFILLTARREGDDSVTSLVCLPGDLIPGESLTGLSLGMLQTVSHASLDLKEFLIPEEYLLPISPKALRKNLKRWSIVERVLIMESFIAVMLHIARRMLINDLTLDSLQDLLAAREAASHAAITAALAGEHIPNGNADTQAAFKEYEKIGEIIRSRQENNGIPESISLRYKDLGLIAGIGL